MPDIPPGHRILLSNFVMNVREQLNPYCIKFKPVESLVQHSKNTKVKNICVTAVSGSDYSTDIDHGVDLADTTSNL